VGQAAFQVALVCFCPEHQKIEVVGILCDFLSEIGLRRREGTIKIGDGFPLTPVESALDLVNQNRPAPAVMDGGPSVPHTLVTVGNLVEQLLQVCINLALGIEPKRSRENVRRVTTFQPALERPVTGLALKLRA